MQHRPVNDPAREMLTTIKRSLIESRIHAQEGCAKARRAGDGELAERLYDVTERISAELDYPEMKLARLT